MTKEEFVARAKHFNHNYDYDYSDIEYVDKDTPVEVRCPKHDSFKVSPMKHLYGSICPRCHKENLLSE